MDSGLYKVPCLILKFRFQLFSAPYNDPYNDGPQPYLPSIRLYGRGPLFSPWNTIARGIGTLDNAFLLQLRDGQIVAATAATTSDRTGRR